jgi:iron complex outermembrane recepter protein
MNAKPQLLACAVLAALALPLAVRADQPAATPAMTEAEMKALLDKLSIVGLGETRQVQRLDATEAERYPAGTSLLKLLDRLPGVHFTNADPFGSYGWAKRISIRGFTQQQLGFTLDRVPLGDQSYGNHNGLHAGRALIAENLGVLELSQGGGTLDTASTSNLGGTVRITSDTPDYDFRLRFDQSFGSDSFQRSYARIDTGDRGGWRAYVSALHSETDKWKGWGPQRQNQLNTKLVKEWERLTVTGFFNASRRAETDYADLSLVSTAVRGWGWDNYAPDWQRAIDVANTQCNAIYVNECEDAYYLGRGLRDDDLGYVTADWSISDTAGLIVTAYKHSNEGQGHWANPYPPGAALTPGFPIALRTSEYYIDRWGVMPTLTMFLGDHKVEAGIWIERNNHDFVRNFYPLRADTPPNRAAFVENPIFRDFAAAFEVETLSWFVQDRINLMDGRMTVDIGFKGVEVDYDSRRTHDARESQGPGRVRFANGSISAKDNFVPKAAARYAFTQSMEGFLSYGENISVYRAGVAGLFNTSQLTFDQIKQTLEPETSRTIEGGLRLVTPRFEGSLIVYDVLFENRLLTIQACPAIAGCVAGLANVGSVETRGVELAGLWRINDGLEWYNSAAFNNSEYADDYFTDPTNPATLVPAAGKTVVDSPKWLVSSNLSWTFGSWDLRLGAKYTSKRYFTFLNDGAVDGYTIANLGLIYRLPELAWAQSGRIQFNVTNLFDKQHHSTIGSNGFFTRYNAAGYMHTLQEGAPRQAFVTASFTF